MTVLFDSFLLEDIFFDESSKRRLRWEFLYESRILKDVEILKLNFIKIPSTAGRKLVT